MPVARIADVGPQRASIVAAGRRLGARGLISAGEGNLSIRVGDDLLITPSGRRKDELSPDDLVLVPSRAPSEQSTQTGAPRPSSDVAIHRAVYATRRDVTAVVHAHLPAAMALTLGGEVPDPSVLPETALLLPRVPFVRFAAPGSAELAAAVAAGLAESTEPLAGAVLLERHGAIAVGSGMDTIAALDEAVDRLELLEVLCRTWRDALLVRAAVTHRSGRTMLRPPSPAQGSPAGRRARRQS
jgi:ribulose-5-phosphate 4-epimerase/fuculose-1-phosphate aldolase